MFHGEPLSLQLQSSEIHMSPGEIQLCQRYPWILDPSRLHRGASVGRGMLGAQRLGVPGGNRL